MNFNEALEIKNNNRHLIGQKYRGGIIDEIIIRPVNENDFEIFMKSYLRTMNSGIALKPFINSELRVDVICDKEKINRNNLILRTEIEKLIDENLDVKL